MRKLAAVLLALIIALSISAAAFATATEDTEQIAPVRELDADEEDAVEPDDEELAEPNDEEVSEIEGEGFSIPGGDAGELLAAVAPVGTNPDTGVSPMLAAAIAAGIASVAVLAVMLRKRAR